MKGVRIFFGFLVAFVSAFSFFGCSDFFESEYSKMTDGADGRGREISEKVIGFINDKDVSSLLQLFSQNERDLNGNLEEEIRALVFEFPNGIGNDDYSVGDTGGTYGFSDGEFYKVSENVRVTIGERILLISFTTIYTPDKAKEGVGRILLYNAESGDDIVRAGTDRPL